MKQAKIAIKKLVLIIILISTLIMFFATPVSNAELDLEQDEFYYSGSTEGTYKPGTNNIFRWLLKALGEIADYILGILTMGVRMVFVGWTALLERALTWAVETSAGVSVDGSVVADATDLTALTDSNNNITVEAIVYNKVAAFDVDIFETEFDRTISATGHKLVCEKCESYTDEMGLERFKPKYVEDCANPARVQDIIDNPSAYKNKKIEDIPDFCSGCSCAGICDGCRMYYEQLKVEKPTIFILKENLAMWYYIIRMLAMAIMLVVLIFIGIKMAISTIASDKAVYKRMFVDWVVGMIMIFTLHYFMIFVITLNGIVVGIVEETAQSVNQASLEQASKDLGLNLHDKLFSKDLEIRVYEEVRSRAYDAKLSNGVIGMVMYMALVFMSIKYTLIYLKRLLTVMVLTLMAPGVGVAYALQRVFTGKSQALKTWMLEYIMNVIIQIIHAIIYAVFISQALLLSLTNIAGMIVALVFLNYASKAQDTFKKVFKFGGKDSLLGHTENALQSVQENIATAKGLVVGAPAAAKVLTNTPYGKAVKALGKTAAAGTALVMEKNRQKRAEKKYNKKMETEKSDIEASVPEGGQKPQGAELSQLAFENLRERNIIAPNPKTHEEGMKVIIEKKKKAEEEAEEAKGERDQAEMQYKQAQEKLAADPENVTLQEDAAAAKAAFDKAEEKYKLATGLRDRYSKLAGVLPGDQAKKHAKNTFNIDNYFQFRKGASFADKASVTAESIFGEVEFDPIKMKYVNKGNGLYKTAFSPKRIGLDDKGIKMLKEHGLKPLVNTVLGFGGLFIGMGTIVTEPKMGMALLAGGAAKTSSVFKKVKGVKKCKDSYTFARFSPEAIKRMQERVKEGARSEGRKVAAQNTQRKRPGFVERFKKGDIKAVTLGIALSPAVAPAIPAALLTAGAVKGFKAIRHPKTTLEGMKKSGEQVAAMIRDPQLAKSMGIEKANNLGKGIATFGHGLKTSTRDVAHNTVNTVKYTASATGRGIKNTVRFTKDKAYRQEQIVRATTIGKEAVTTGKATAKATFKRVLEGNEHYETVSAYIQKERVKLEKKLEHDAEKLSGQQTKAELSKNLTAAIGLFAESSDEEIKTMEDLGYSYSEETEKFVRKESVEENDINEDALKKQGPSSRPSQKVVDDALAKVLEKHIKDGKIDLSSKGLQQTIITELTTELVNSKLIEKGQSAEEVFKGGKVELIKVMKGKAGKLSEQSQADSALSRVLSKDEISLVKRVTETSMKKGGNQPSVTDILSSIGGELKASNDGSQKVSFSEAGSVVDKGNSGDLRVVFGDGAIGSQKAEAVRNYVTARQSVPKERSYQRRDKKVSQALNAIMMPEVEDVPTQDQAPKFDLEGVLGQIAVAQKNTSADKQSITIGGIQIEMNQKELASMREAVRSMSSAQRMNTSAKTYKMGDGTRGHVKNAREKSSLSAEIKRLERDKLYMEQNPGVEIKRPDPGNGGELKKQTAEAINARITAKQKEHKRLEAQTAFVGPVIDIHNVLSDINKRKADERAGKIKPKRKGGGK